jgi:hypothetical protein
MIDLGHIGKALRVELRRAACDNNAGVGIVFLGAPNRAAGLAHGFIGHSAAIDNDAIAQIIIAGMGRHNAAFIGIKPAAQRDNLGRFGAGYVGGARYVGRLCHCGYVDMMSASVKGGDAMNETEKQGFNGVMIFRRSFFDKAMSPPSFIRRV